MTDDEVDNGNGAVLLVRGKKTKSGVDLDAVLVSNLKDIAYLIHHHNFDWAHLNSGLERGGKSGFALLLAWFLSKVCGMKFDWSPAMSHVFFYDANTAEKMMNIENGSVVILDEGGEALFSRKAMSAIAIEVVQTLMRYGSKNIFLIINIPDWRWIDKYVRTSRVRSLARIRTKPKRVKVEGEWRVIRERGFYRFHSRKQVIRATRMKEKLGEPVFAGRFPDFRKEHPQEWAWYEVKKFAFLHDSAQRLKEKRELTEKKEEQARAKLQTAPARAAKREKKAGFNE